MYYIIADSNKTFIPLFEENEFHEPAPGIPFTWDYLEDEFIFHHQWSKWNPERDWLYFGAELLKVEMPGPKSKLGRHKYNAKLGPNPKIKYPDWLQWGGPDHLTCYMAPFVGQTRPSRNINDYSEACPAIFNMDECRKAKNEKLEGIWFDPQPQLDSVIPYFCEVLMKSSASWMGMGAACAAGMSYLF